MIGLASGLFASGYFVGDISLLGGIGLAVLCVVCLVACYLLHDGSEGPNLIDF